MGNSEIPQKGLYTTPSLDFSAFLILQGFPLVDTSISSRGEVVFQFDSRKGRKQVSIQKLYERYLIGDEFLLSPYRFTQEWRKLRRVVDLVIKR